LVDPGQAEADEEEQSEEFKTMLDICNLDLSFMRWMQLQVAYRIGQDILTSKAVLSVSILPKLDISTVTAGYPSGTNCEMEPWDALLRSQHFHFLQGFDVEAAINMIKEKSRFPLVHPAIPSSRSSSCQIFCQIFWEICTVK
jgi:hypothetical protein